MGINTSLASTAFFVLAFNIKSLNERYIMYYAGIGSRQTPDNILHIMKLLAIQLQQLDYILRSGGAIGADKAFESGANTRKDIYYANQASEPAIQLASQYHPAWHRCSSYVKQLHGRNMHILLGSDINNPKPVDFIICWTPNAEIIDGTGQTLRYAIDKGIKIYNIENKDDLLAIHQLIERMNVHNKEHWFSTHSTPWGIYQIFKAFN